MNYLAWTANFGVVPLFLLAALRLAPIARFFALRRFSVIAVLEAISISLSKNRHLSDLKLLNVAISLLIVKIFLVLPSAVFAKTMPSDVILAKGEQKELEVGRVKHFSVGNPEVISYRLDSKKGKLLIKGKKVGFTDLIVWTHVGKKVFSLYVLTKQKFLKTFQLAEALKNLNLDIDIKGPVMTAAGEISDFSDYLYLHKVKKQFQEQVYLRITLTASLRNFIIGQVYKKLYEAGFPIVNCQVAWLDVRCHFEGTGNQALLEKLSGDFMVHFVKQDSTNLRKNYRLKLKLIQVERLDGKEIHLGLDKLKSTPFELFEFGLRKLLEDNLILLSQSHLELSTLAEPEMIVNLNQAQSVEIGSQIPYQNLGVKGSGVIAPIDWRFAGLLIRTKLTEASGRFFLEYETEFSRPVGDAISGSKEKSSALLEPGTPLKIFQIGFQTSSATRKGLPGLMDIPILRTLFSSKSDQETYKRIDGYVALEEVE